MDSGLLIEFETTSGLLDGLRRLRSLGLPHGVRELETFTPWPIHGVDELLDLPKSRVSRNVLIGGLLGAATGYIIQWWCNAIDYPVMVGGRPPHAAPAFILITFETMVLFAGLTAFFSLLVFARLPRLWHPTFEIEPFRRASIDRFWIGVSAGDGALDVDAIRIAMFEVGALNVVPFGEST